MRYWLGLLVSLWSGLIWAQEITPQMLREFHENTVISSSQNNLLAYNGLKLVALDQLMLSKLDGQFSYVIQRPGVTNQRQSGRCWLFATLNVLRYDMGVKLGQPNLELSENYLFFFHKLELANYMFERVIQFDLSSAERYFVLTSGLSDGGYWNMATSLIEKYGVVPRSAMPETLNSNSTTTFNDLLNQLVKKHFVGLQDAKAAGTSTVDLRAMKDGALNEVYRFLSLTLSEPPTTFSFKHANKSLVLTPRQFLKQFSTLDLASQVMLIHDPNRSYYQRYRIKWSKNAIEDDGDVYVNVPMPTMLALMKQSVYQNRPVWFGCDVMRYFDRQSTLKLGVYNFDDLFGLRFDASKAERLRGYATAATHAMVIMGLNEEQGVVNKWLVQNSWGAASGNSGYLSMYTDWFEEYGFQVVIDRRFLTPEIQQGLETPIIEIDAWDYLYWK